MFSGALKKVTGSSSSRASSHRSSTPMPSFSHHDEQAESQAPEEQPAQPEEEAPDDSHLDIQGERELQAYNILKARTFGHTWEFDDDLLEKTGMNTEFANVWKAVGWSSFADVIRMGSWDLTIQFLCTLVETDTGISFRFFGKEFVMSWRDLSTVLGFTTNALLMLS